MSIYFPYIRSHTTQCRSQGLDLKVFDTLPIYQPQEVYRIFAVEMESQELELSLHKQTLHYH